MRSGALIRHAHVSLLLLGLALILFAFLSCGESPTASIDVKEDWDDINLSRRLWYQSSPPMDPDREGFEKLEAAKRQRFFWYNLEPLRGARRQDFDPGMRRGASTLVVTMDIELDTVSADSSAWAGIMTGFRRCRLDLSQRRFLEIWINDFKPDPQTRGGLLYIDIGCIDEDFFEASKNEFNTEDQDRNGWTPNEDTGLDGVIGGNDEYCSQRIDGRFTRINGTETNGLHDTEDLDRSGLMETINSYFEFVIDLGNDEPIRDVRREYPDFERFNQDFHRRDSWRKYRIEVSAGIPVVGPSGLQPDLENIHHIRIWFENVQEVVQKEENPGIGRLQIADLRFVK